MKAVTETKIQLSTMNSVKFFFMTEDLDEYGGTVTREQFNGWTRDLCDRAMEILIDTLAELDDDVDLNSAVLVGGSSNMPQIQEAVKDNLSHRLSEDEIGMYKPSRAIAIGAVHNCQMRMSTSHIKLLDGAPYTYGISTYRHFGNKVEKCVLNMIHKGTRYPEGNKPIMVTSAKAYPKDRFYRKVIFEVYESDIKQIGSGEDIVRFDHRLKDTGMRYEFDIPSKYWGKANEFYYTRVMVLPPNGTLEIYLLNDGNRIIGRRTEVKI